jgi:hypothetical protein
MSDVPDELPVLIGPGQGEPETLILISTPNDGGEVKTRSWTAADWSAVPKAGATPAAALYQRLESASKHGRTMNQSLTQLRLWLLQ